MTLFQLITDEDDLISKNSTETLLTFISCTDPVFLANLVWTDIYYDLSKINFGENKNNAIRVGNILIKVCDKLYSNGCQEEFFKKFNDEQMNFINNLMNETQNERNINY